MDKLYIIVRADLSPGQQAVQAIHAMRQWSEEHPEADREWFQRSNTVALLTAKDELAVGVISERARRQGIPVACFREPDRNNELTAIAVGPQGKRLTRNLPLALQWSSSSPSLGSRSPSAF